MDVEIVLSIEHSLVLDMMGKILDSLEKLFVILVFAIIGGIVGFFLRLFAAPTILLPLSGLAIQFIPYMVLSALVFSLIAYRFPNFASECYPFCDWVVYPQQRRQPILTECRGCRWGRTRLYH